MEVQRRGGSGSNITKSVRGTERSLLPLQELDMSSNERKLVFKKTEKRKPEKERKEIGLFRGD